MQPREASSGRVCGFLGVLSGCWVDRLSFSSTAIPVGEQTHCIQRAMSEVYSSPALGLPVQPHGLPASAHFPGFRVSNLPVRGLPGKVQASDGVTQPCEAPKKQEGTEHDGWEEAVVLLALHLFFVLKGVRRFFKALPHPAGRAQKG